MKLIPCTLAAVLLVSALTVQPADAACWWNGWGWRCAPSWGWGPGWGWHRAHWGPWRGGWGWHGGWHGGWHHWRHW
jgi:hypothetical protein